MSNKKLENSPTFALIGLVIIDQKCFHQDTKLFKVSHQRVFWSAVKLAYPL